MFLTLTNVQSGGAVSLLKYIDNRSGNVRVGLRSVTYAVGWYNVEAGESISLRSAGADARRTTTEVPPGLYSQGILTKFLVDAVNFGLEKIATSTNLVNGLITLTVGNGWEVLLTDGLLMLLGLDNGFGGQWLDAGTYTGDRPVNFATTKTLRFHLEQLDSTHNAVDGTPSTLLATIGLGRHAFGDISTFSIPHPEFKHLCGGTVDELKVVMHGDTGKILDNHNLPISVTLEFQL